MDSAGIQATPAAAKPFPKFRPLDSAEVAAVDSLLKKGQEPFRGIDITDIDDLRVRHCWQRDGFCVCTVLAGPVAGYQGYLCWSGVSKRSPYDKHNETRGRMLAFVRAALATPATW